MRVTLRQVLQADFHIKAHAVGAVGKGDIRLSSEVQALPLYAVYRLVVILLPAWGTVTLLFLRPSTLRVCGT